jgi:arylsulfatase A-like enzyme
VDHYDLFQALCEWGGVEHDAASLARRRYPGRSLAPLARGEPVPDWPLARYGEYGDLRMIRTSEFKFVKRYPHGPHELFALRDDPGELSNLANEPSLFNVRQSLERQLEEWYRAHEDPAKSGLHVKSLPVHNSAEAWRDGRREARGLQI